VLVARLWSLFSRKRLDTELDLEIRHHLESLEAGHRARGLSEDDARRAALRDFGGFAQVKEAYRDQRGIPMLETLWRDVRFGVRSIKRSPAVTIAVIATLAIGIGANTAIFSVVNGVLIKPLPFPDSDRLITLAHAAPGVVLSDSPDVGSSLFLYFIEREQNRSFEGVGIFGEGRSTVTGRGEPEEIRRFFVTADVLPILGIEPLIGRDFSESDDSPGSPNTVLLTYGYWQRRFAGDPSILGQSLTINGEPWRIIGVMPQRFSPPNRQADVITPMRLDRAQVTVGGYFRRSIARLKPGVTLEQASADVKRLIPIAIDSFPLGSGTTRDQVESARLSPNLRPLKQDVVGDAGRTLWVLMGTIGIVLLIACANVANLILVRTEGRQMELSIRAALGAGWRRIARELLTESAVLGVIGGLCGIGFAYVGLRAILAVAPANLPRREEIVIDATVLLFTLGLSLFVGLLFGTFPVVRYARPRLAAVLSSGGRWLSQSRERIRARAVLVVGQVALALVLLICSGLMIRTFLALNRVNPGFAAPDEVQTVGITIQQASVRDPELVVRRQNDILNGFAALPGVTSVAYTSAAPMDGGFTADLLFPEGKTFGEGNPPKGRQFRFISPAFFRTMGIPMVAGRDFTWTDIYEKRAVVLVSENLAHAEWGSAQQALGKRLRGSSSQDQWREIVGIVGDIRDWGLSQPLTETVYVPVLAERIFNTPISVSRSITYTIRSPRTATPGFLEEIRQAVWTVDSNLPLVNVRTMGDLVDDSLARTSATVMIMAIAGAMALLMGLIGIYAVISYTVAQRTREVGIRMAMGAQKGEIRRMFLKQGLWLVAVGIAVGLACAAALTRLMSSLLFGVSPLDPATYVAVSGILVVAAVSATYLPSRRATLVDPIDTLRQ
jgi:predicted permease